MKTFFQVICVSLGLAFIWPQVWRAVRHDTSHGISPFGVLHAIIGSALWFTYGVLEKDIAIWFTNISFIVAQSIITLVIYRHGKIQRNILIQIGIALMVIDVVRTENLHGISISSYLITIVNCSSWLIYGFVVDDFMISAQNFFAIPIIVYITVRAMQWRSANPDYVSTES